LLTDLSSFSGSRQFALTGGGVAYEHSSSAEAAYYFIDEGIKDLTGYAVDEMTPKLFSSLTAEWAGQLNITASVGDGVSLEAHEKEATIYETEYRIRAADGRVVWLSDSSIVIRGSNGEIVRCVGMLQDITERKRAEEEIRELNEGLEQRVASRTMELERANAELKDFAYVVSHDLKAPLRAISQLADWISQDYAHVFNEDGKEQMGLLIGRAERMDSLINGILQYSRVGRIGLEEMSVDLNKMVREVIDMLAPPDYIQVTIENELPTIICDTTRISQVFQNLLGNAIKFMDKPSGAIKIGCVDEGDCWKFSIADNGPGIDSQYHEKIFQIFQTLTSRDELESTGIGLTIVSKIIELHGGRIWLESAVGVGTTFFFTLPKKREAEMITEAAILP